ncbi:MAG: hypothetical protein JWN28_450 [Candidatus Saccharibacteria bacterium]|nr:hypothetical protein [Candidatus Saccharibacteria bacterium]
MLCVVNKDYTLDDSSRIGQCMGSSEVREVHEKQLSVWLCSNCKLGDCLTPPKELDKIGGRAERELKDRVAATDKIVLEYLGKNTQFTNIIKSLVDPKDVMAVKAVVSESIEKTQAKHWTEFKNSDRARTGRKAGNSRMATA